MPISVAIDQDIRLNVVPFRPIDGPAVQPIRQGLGPLARAAGDHHVDSRRRFKPNAKAMAAPPDPSTRAVSWLNSSGERPSAVRASSSGPQGRRFVRVIADKLLILEQHGVHAAAIPRATASMPRQLCPSPLPYAGW